MGEAEVYGVSFEKGPAVCVPPDFKGIRRGAEFFGEQTAKQELGEERSQPVRVLPVTEDPGMGQGRNQGEKFPGGDGKACSDVPKLKEQIPSGHRKGSGLLPVWARMPGSRQRRRKGSKPGRPDIFQNALQDAPSSLFTKPHKSFSFLVTR